MLKIKHITPPYCLLKIGMLALVCGAMLASCQKEGETTTLKLFTEESNSGDSKMAVDGMAMRWCNGDVVCINNNGTFSVNVNSSGATVTAGYYPFETPLRAVTPNITSSSLDDNQCSVSLPATYNYATTTRNNVVMQHLATPMAAYTRSGDQLHFKYLTGALTVNLKNTTGKTIYVEDITITSNYYQLSGYKTIDFTALTNIQPETTDVEAYRTVTMKCNREAVAAGATLPVQIPVLPVGTNNRFTVTVRYIVNFDETTSVSDANPSKNYYTFSATQPSRTTGLGNSLGRGELGYVPVELKETLSPGYQKDFFFKDESYYYLIGTPKELKWLSVVSSTSDFTLGQKVRLTNNIDMTSQRYFAPIQKVTEFDGCNKTISNLEMLAGGYNNHTNGLLYDGSSSSSGYTGITVNDLTMDNCTLKIQVSTAFAGFIAGYANQNVTITNCNVTNSKVEFVTSSTNSITLDIGGICGRVDGNSTLSACRVENLRFVVGDYLSSYDNLRCGGLIGYSTYQSLFENCYVSITSSGNLIKNTKDNGYIHFGGFVGYHSINNNSSGWLIIKSTNYKRSDVVINNLEVRGTKNTSTVYAGAFCGYMNPSYPVNLRNSYHTTIQTSGQFTVYTVNSNNKHIGSAGNNYVCGNGVNPYIQEGIMGAEYNLNLTIN